MNGDAAAQSAQLFIEYAPAPPFDSGHPDTAPPAILERARAKMAARRESRIALVEEVVKRRQA